LRCPSLTFEFLLAFCAVFFLCFVVVLWRCRLRGVEHHRRVGMAPSTSFWTISHGFPGYMPPRTRRGTHSTILCRGNLGSDEGWCFFSFFFGPFPLFMVILYDPYSKPRPDTIRPSSRYDHRGTGLKRQPSSLPSLPQHSHRPCLSGADWCLHSDVVCPMHAWYSPCMLGTPHACLVFGTIRCSRRYPTTAASSSTRCRTTSSTASYYRDFKPTTHTTREEKKEGVWGGWGVYLGTCKVGQAQDTAGIASSTACYYVWGTTTWVALADY